MEYKEIISRYSFEQLVYENAIVDEEKTIVYNKEKALKEEFKRRLRDRNV